MPLFFLSYYIVDNKFKNLCIFLYSLGFYFFACFDHPEYFLIFIFSLMVNYIIAIQIEIVDYEKRPLLLVVALIYNFSILFVFKYFDFFIDIIHSLNSGSDIKKLNLVLPIGISFYTFQIVSYVVDVYNKKINAEVNFVNFATYVSMFPQLIAGPIVRYSDLMGQIKSERDVKIDDIINGFTIFVFGLSSKVIVANMLSLVSVDLDKYGLETISTLTAWGVAISSSMQMYFDFFGYSLMAIGLGKMMGFDIVENFKDPFLSRSVEEYWRRWHISLSTWFRDYLLYPLQMSAPIRSLRKFLKSTFDFKTSNLVVNLIAIFVVWIATGLWHGANYNFILWGLYFYIFLSIEQIFLSKILKRFEAFSHIYLIIVIIISFVIFFNEDLSSIKLMLKKMFLIDSNLIGKDFFNIIINNIKQIILGIVCVLRLPNIIYDRIKKYKILRVLIVVLLLSLSIYIIYRGYNDPFMYFRF